MNSEATVVVVGAGVSGLCVAHWLRKHGVNVLVLEKESHSGGTMKTLREDGWLIEAGPNTALETTPLFQPLLEDIGLAEKRIYADSAASKRYILRDGTLHALPMGLVSFLTSRLWTWRGKLRLLKEPFVGRADNEESVAEFVRRRLGSEFLDYAINPFVAGVFAGNPESLSVQAAFPKLYALEEKYGGLIKGLVKGRKERKQRAEKAKSSAKLFSFVDGIQSLPDALATSLGDSIRYNCPVETIIPVRAGRFPVYTVYGPNAATVASDVRAVVLSAPAYATAGIIHPIDPEMAKTLESIYYPPVAEVFMGFRQEQVGQPLDGFGFLIPEKEQRKILGTIWSSVLFPGRAPHDHAALTTFLGGARQPALTEQDDESIASAVLSELKTIMRVEGPPVYTKVTRWPKAIPQYSLRYPSILNAMTGFEQNFRGAFLCSNFRGGIAVGDCVANAEVTTNKVLEHLKLVGMKPQEVYLDR
jgi:oxygen-dependent protoporphyrinogen oxidase